MTAETITRIIVGLGIWTVGSIVLGLLLGAVIDLGNRTPKDW